MKTLDKIKASVVSFALASCMFGIPGVAFADEGTVDNAGTDAPVVAPDETEGTTYHYTWEVTFVGDGMKETGNGDLVQMLSNLQPGSSAEYTIYLFNDCDEDVDWYMWNKVWKTMEDMGAAKDGGYTYELLYFDDPDSDEATVIYSNAQVGGVEPSVEETPTPETPSPIARNIASNAGTDAQEETTPSSGGLFNATQRSGMEDYFHLGTFAPGAKKSMKLTMAIDGETHANNYFDTMAGTQLRFAAEPVDEGGETIYQDVPGEPTYQTDPSRTRYVGGNLPQTGDMLPAISILCLFAGCIVLAIGATSYLNDRKKRKEANHD